MLHQVGFLGECSVASPLRLQDMIFKVINYVALGASLDEKKGDELTFKEHPIRHIVHLFAEKYKAEKCVRRSNTISSQKRLIEQLLQGLDPAIKNHTWKILSSSPLQVTMKKLNNLKEFSSEFFRHLCLNGLQSSEERIEFCGETEPSNSTAHTHLEFFEKNRRKRFVHPDDKVLDKIIRRAGYAHDYYEEPAQPEVVIVVEEEENDKGKKLFVPKILVIVGTYILLVLLSFKAFFLSRAGEKGDKGEPGMDGVKGDKGLKGFPGHKGKQGFPGYKGEKGEPGADGLPGEKGEKGIPGEMGFPGEKGHPGEKGDTGEKGEKGVKGQKGQQGKPGHRGPRGPRGRPAFHSTHRKKRELYEIRSRFEFNQINKNDSKYDEPTIKKSTELIQDSFESTLIDRTVNKVPTRVMGPGPEKDKNFNPQTMEVNFATIGLETQSLHKNNLETTNPSVFPVGPDGRSPQKELPKVLSSEKRQVSPNESMTSQERKTASNLFQQLQQLSVNRNTLNPYGENEFIISAMNELWQLYQTPNGCIPCRLFEYLIEQPSMDLDSYIMAGFAHVLGDTGSLQLLDQVRRAKTQKKTLRCIQYDVNQCRVEPL
ncbi:Collagen triple helix repeat [Trinorchestia longiramus]|nr:Collagen triple helix repeat [Trinorchestia longiramus]